MAAPYTLMRAALENASLGLWLLAPADPVERRRRKLLLELDDAYDSAQARKLVGRSLAKSFEQKQNELLVVADRAGVPRNTLVGRRLGWAAKVREAGVASGVGADSLEFTWCSLSGYTHGRRWAHLAIGEREALTESVDGVVTYSLTASIPALTLAVLQARQVLDAVISAETKAGWLSGSTAAPLGRSSHKLRGARRAGRTGEHEGLPGDQLSGDALLPW